MQVDERLLPSCLPCLHKANQARLASLRSDPSLGPDRRYCVQSTQLVAIVGTLPPTPFDFANTDRRRVGVTRSHGPAVRSCIHLGLSSQKLEPFG